MVYHSEERVASRALPACFAVDRSVLAFHAELSLEDWHGLVAERLGSAAEQEPVFLVEGAAHSVRSVPEVGFDLTENLHRPARS